MPVSSDNDGRSSEAEAHAPRAMKLGRHRIALPRSRWLRILLGGGLVVGGLLWFLPVLGLWMLPLGVGVLSIDLPPVRRLRRRIAIRWGRSDAHNHADDLVGWARRRLRKIRSGCRD